MNFDTSLSSIPETTGLLASQTQPQRNPDVLAKTPQLTPIQPHYSSTLQTGGPRFRADSFASDNFSLMSDSFIQYGSTVQELFIQHRRNSMLSTKMSALHLAPTKTADNDALLEAETTLSIEVKMLMKSSIPLIITFLLQYSLTVASVFTIGGLGSSELAAVSLANLMVNITSYGIIQGIASSLSTLCPQAYGRRDFQAVGLHTLRCTMLLFAVFIPIFSFLYWGSYPLLNSLVPDPGLCKLASQYLRRLVFGVPGFILFEVLKQYLQAQGIFQASTYVLVFCAPFNVFLNYFFVWDPRFGMGFIGAPTAVLITNWLMALLLLFYASCINGYQCWCGFTSEVFQNWGRILKLAGPGVLMIEAEWLAFEIITFAASRFGTTSLAAQSIVSTACLTMYQIPFAVSVAASTRIAWFIGSASKDAAILATKTALISGVIVGFINCVIMFSGKHFIATLFSREAEVVDLASRVLIISAGNQVLDVVACVCSGILRGCGKQRIGAGLSLVSYYVIALPVAFVCAFPLKMELFGLWISMLVAITFIAITELYVVLTTNWDQVIKQSIEDGIAEQHSQGGDYYSDDESNVLVPAKSIASLVEHSMINPGIAPSRDEVMGITNLTLA